jgi:hypothetical protein
MNDKWTSSHSFKRLEGSSFIDSEIVPYDEIQRGVRTPLFWIFEQGLWISMGQILGVPRW